MNLKTDDNNLSDFFDETEEMPVKRNPFASLEKKLGITEGSTKLPSKKELKEVKVAVNDAINETKELVKEEAFEDQEYIRSKLKLTIERLENQLATIEETTLIGAEPRIFETYAVMSKTHLEAIGKLMDLWKQISTTTANNNILGNPGTTTLIEEKVTRKIKSSDFGSFLDGLKEDPEN